MEISKLLAALDAFEHGPPSGHRFTTDPSEGGRLAGHFNRLIDSLEETRTVNESLRSQVREVQQAEREMRAARDAADAASQSKSQFLANMSHELRTPLNAIIGFSELLQEELGEAATADLQTIHSSGKHLLSLINDILDLAKIEAGKMELFNESFDVGKLVDEVGRTVAPMVAKRENQLIIGCPVAIGAMHGDQTRLRQCLLNLLSNAAKFSEKSLIQLDVSLAGGKQRETLRFEVIDHGIGMTAEEIDRLFQPFVQANASTSKEFGGTGLGLAISRKFCVMMGGDLTVVSTPGQGTKFTVILPRGSAAANTALSPVLSPSDTPKLERLPSAKAATVAAQQGNRPVVLVIDDDPNVREIMSRYLSNEGWHPIPAANGVEGLALARELHPAAITLDVVMPQMDGWAVLEALKADPDLATIPVVMVTIVDDKRQGYALGASQFLSKPIERTALTQALSRFRCMEPPCTVLLVEDDEATRKYTSRMLKGAGWSVSEAANGREALEQLRQAVPMLILLDLMMPEMDGFEFLKELRSAPEWRHLPVIVVTAKDLNEDDRRQLTLGVESILRKAPESREELLALVRDTLSSSVGAPPPSVKAPTRRLHVLVADDHLFNRRLAVRMLERMGHSVVVATNGLEAVASAREQNFDLIFLDVEMPEMDGLEAATTIRAATPRAGAKRVPIIAMTAHAQEDQRANCVAAGMDDFVSKPVEPEDLARAIESCLAGKSLASFSDFGPELASIRRLAPSDSAFVRELAQAFLDDTATHLAGFQNAIDRLDGPLAHRSALSLKVLLASVAAEGLSELAQHAATAAAAGDISVLRGFASPLADGLAEVRFSLEDDLRTFAM